MSEDYEEFQGLPDDVVSLEDVVSHVLDNNWDEVLEAVGESQGREWLNESATALGLLSTVSQRDRAHMRGAMKKWLRKKQTDSVEPTEGQIFAIASDVSAYLEQLITDSPFSLADYQIGLEGYAALHKPTARERLLLSARSCSLDGDLSWAEHLLRVTRAFRDVLSAVSDSDIQAPYLGWRLREPVQVLNSFVRETPPQLLIYWQAPDKKPAFGRSPDAKAPNLSSYIASWACDYLGDHYLNVGLGACAECGKFFVRERRDKSFCSKTCQNRVAYKRKKLLESDALTRVNISPDDACDIAAGLWIYHPRYGIGLVESLSSASKPTAPLLPKTAENTANLALYRSMLSRKVILQVHFLHGVRMLGFRDLFEGQKREEQLPTFYSVKSEEILAELL
jgi:hypothetical protein